MKAVVDALAARDWRQMGAQSVAAAKGLLTTHIRRRWAAVFRRANSRLSFMRLETARGLGRYAQAQAPRGDPDDWVRQGAMDVRVQPDVGGGDALGWRPYALGS